MIPQMAPVFWMMLSKKHCSVPGRCFSFLHICTASHITHKVKSWDCIMYAIPICYFQTQRISVHPFSPTVNEDVTFSFDPQCCSDQCKESSIKHDSPITIQWHIHGDEALWGREKKHRNHAESVHTKNGNAFSLQTFFPRFPFSSTYADIAHVLGYTGKGLFISLVHLKVSAQRTLNYCHIL